jgi:hypothetical protein
MRETKTLIAFVVFACHFANAQALTAFSPTTGMSGKDFGSFLAIDHNNILVSSISDAVTPGKVYAFNNENGIVQTAVFYPDDALATDGFGQSLSVSNDLIAIGSRFHNVSDGAVYTYKKNNGNWEFLQKITPSDGNPEDNFGAAVKIFGEYLFITATNDEMDERGQHHRQRFCFCLQMERHPMGILTKAFCQSDAIYIHAWRRQTSGKTNRYVQ